MHIPEIKQNGLKGLNVSWKSAQKYLQFDILWRCQAKFSRSSRENTIFVELITEIKGKSMTQMNCRNYSIEPKFLAWYFPATIADVDRLTSAWNANH